MFCFTFHFSVQPLIYNLKLGIVNEEIQDCNVNFDQSKVSCKFLQHLSDDEIIGLKFYETFDEAFRDLNAGKINGLVHFASNFTETFRLTSDEAYYRTPVSGEINVYFIGLNFHKTVFLKIRTLKIYQKFSSEVARSFGLSEKIIKIPLKFEMINKASETGFRETLLPPFTIS